MPSPIRRCVALLVATALVAPAATMLTTTPAHAQKPKSLRDQLPEEAKKHWDAALQLSQRNQWDGARASFNAAYEASKNPRVLFNVAVCEKNLGRYGHAIEIFKRELAEAKGQLSAAEESDLKAQISGLERYVAQLTIEVNEPGAEIYVDDSKVGTSPLTASISVQLGERRVRATKAGFADAQKSIELKGGSSGTVQLKLVPNVKTQLVSVSVIGPPSATVKVDGKEVGAATKDQPYKGQVTVSAEPHQFSAEATGWVPATQSAIVRETDPLNLTLQLSEEQQKGKLLVVAKPEGATIEIDGKPVGASRWEGPVGVGTHQIVVKKQGHYTWSYDVDVPKGGERAVTASLNEDRNTSFVPWLIGTLLVVGGTTIAVIVLGQPKDQEAVQGSLPPFTVNTPSFVKF